MVDSDNWFLWSSVEDKSPGSNIALLDIASMKRDWWSMFVWEETKDLYIWEMMSCLRWTKLFVWRKMNKGFMYHLAKSGGDRLISMALRTPRSQDKATKHYIAVQWSTALRNTYRSLSDQSTTGEGYQVSREQLSDRIRPQLTSILSWTPEQPVTPSHDLFSRWNSAAWQQPDWYCIAIVSHWVNASTRVTDLFKAIWRDTRINRLQIRSRYQRF